MFQFEEFSPVTLEELFSTDKHLQKKYTVYYNNMHTPLFHIKQVGIGSKLISDWIREGLLNESGEKGKWRMFSLVEAIWLNFIEELRIFGVPLENIKELKKFLFSIDPKILRDAGRILQDSKGLGTALNEFSRMLNDALPESDEELMQQMESQQFSLFASVICASLLLRLNLAFCFNEDGAGFVHLGKPLHPIQEQTRNDFFESLSSKSFCVININNLFTKFFDNDRLDTKNDFYFGLMNKKEQDLITKIRSGDYKQIIIKLADGSISQFRLTKKESDNGLMMKIQRLLKRGDFKEIEIISRDGIIVKFNETDVMK